MELRETKHTGGVGGAEETTTTSRSVLALEAAALSFLCLSRNVQL
jgi:hypothetical protein